MAIQETSTFTAKTGDWLICQDNPSLGSRYWWNNGSQVFQAVGTPPADLKTRTTIILPAHLIAMPTGFDLQTHLRFPGQAQKETLRGGLWSAFAGGYDSIVSMPNTNPFLDDPEILQASISAAQKESDIPVLALFTGAATVGMKGEMAANIAALAQAGACAITDDGWGVRSDLAMADIFRACAAAKIPFLQHAEIGGHKGIATASEFQRTHQLPEYPRSAESEMVKRDLNILAGISGAHYHILHISTQETIDLIRQAKKSGLRVTAEVTPHHLFFSNQDIPAESDYRSTYFKMNPPIFSPEDRAALQAALRDGTIDIVSTDHAPHETELKAKGWRLAPFGTRGLETTIPVLTMLYKQKILSLERWEKIWSSTPRTFIPQAKPAAGFIFIDPDFSYSLGAEHLPGISKNSCFLGQNLQGKILYRLEDKALWQNQ